MQSTFLQLRRCRRIPVQENKVLLKSADKSLALAADNIHNLLDSLLPLLNGTSTEKEVLAALVPELKEDAAEVLRLLGKEGFLETGAEPAKQLAQSLIILISTGRLGETMSRHLRQSGAEQVEEIDAESAAGGHLPDSLQQAAMVVVCTDLPRPDLCEAVNKAALTLKLPWLLVQADGRDGWVGPLFIPGETGCYDCLRQRLLSCSVSPEIDQAIHAAALRQPFTESLELLPPFLDLLAAMAALEAIRHLSAVSPPLTYKTQILLDCISGISRRDVLHRIPRCPSCSTSSEQVSPIQPFSG
ncbi:Bacteriocin biosynthesis cyclodehydratase domain-containing protein [Candidatus Electronema halotolerans]